MPGYTRTVPRRDPHDVLGVPRGASQATIKAAWRKLARAHHPDLTANDAAAAKAATARMAEINQAYQRLRDGDDGRGGPDEEAAARRPAQPPRPRPTRPVTGRVDTTATYRPRNTTTGPRVRPIGHEPRRVDRLSREPLRASDPTGPTTTRRQTRFTPPELPDLETASATVVPFGKFHGHTLGEIAAFEPSYVDWMVRTITRDPDLLFAARAVQRDLDARGVVRRVRPEPTRRGRSPFAYPDD